MLGSIKYCPAFWGAGILGFFNFSLHIVLLFAIRMQVRPTQFLPFPHKDAVSDVRTGAAIYVGRI